jgi:hypothetical protein
MRAVVIRFLLTVMLALATGLTLPAQSSSRALPADVTDVLQNATTFDVLSLNGERDASGWHGHTLLGRTTVARADDRARVIAALQAGVARQDAPGARCFVPRHGIHAVRGATTVDLLICFECSWVYIYRGGSNPPEVVTTTTEPQRAFDDVLRAAGVPRP